jgi:hypothetical protein
MIENGVLAGYQENGDSPLNFCRALVFVGAITIKTSPVINAY